MPALHQNSRVPPAYRLGIDNHIAIGIATEHTPPARQLNPSAFRGPGMRLQKSHAIRTARKWENGSPK
jgi:hypothetical protein